MVDVDFTVIVHAEGVEIPVEFRTDGTFINGVEYASTYATPTWIGEAVEMARLKAFSTVHGKRAATEIRDGAPIWIFGDGAETPVLDINIAERILTAAGK